MKVKLDTNTNINTNANANIEKSLNAPAEKNTSLSGMQETLDEFKFDQNREQFFHSGSTNQINNFQNQSGGLGSINFPQLGVANNPGIGINQQNTLSQGNQFSNEKSNGLGNLSAYGWNKGIGNNANNN